MSREVPEPAVQMGYVVADLDAAIDHWVTHAHVGPWTVFRGVTLNGRYAGADTVVTMDVAMGYHGDLQIELMKITSSTPSPYAKLRRRTARRTPPHRLDHRRSRCSARRRP